MSILHHVRWFFITAAVSRVAVVLYDRVTEGEKSSVADGVVIVGCITWAVLLTIAVEVRALRSTDRASAGPSTGP